MQICLNSFELINSIFIAEVDLTPNNIVPKEGQEQKGLQVLIIDENISLYY